VLKMVLGELASAITGGNNVSPEKIQHVGFQFQHPDLDESLNDLLR
jgi:NAD dependent epimerase/dehydratase family enzyme